MRLIWLFGAHICAITTYGREHAREHVVVCVPDGGSTWDTAARATVHYRAGPRPWQRTLCELPRGKAASWHRDGTYPVGDGGASRFLAANQVLMEEGQGAGWRSLVSIRLDSARATTATTRTAWSSSSSSGATSCGFTCQRPATPERAGGAGRAADRRGAPPEPGGGG